MREARARGVDIVSLMRGEPDFPTSPHIVEACAKALRDGRTGYPDNRGEAGFREAIALKLGRDNGLQFDPATEILATSGATFGIYAALTAILNEGDEVLLPDPIYDAYQSPIRLAGGVVRSVSATIEGDRFSIGIEALERAWSPRTRILILNDPWNPVGTVMTRRELEEVGEFCERRNLWLVSDEIYEAITFAGSEAHLAAGGVAGPARALHPRQQSFEDLCDDGMARGLLRGPGGDYPANVHGAGAIEPRAGDVYSGCRGGRTAFVAGLRGSDA